MRRIQDVDVLSAARHMNSPVREAAELSAESCAIGSSAATATPMPASDAVLAIGASRLRVLCVDGVVPQHPVPRPGARARLVYVSGEVAHFELAGHRYSLVHEDPARGQAIDAEEGASRGSPDIRKLLTNRELQIVQLICMGCLTKQVSHQLRISEFTVRSYLKTIYCKLGVRSRAAMVYRYAQSFGHQQETDAAHALAGDARR
jgi:DNA-binding CsgD family transcriptional regulator